MGELHFTLCFSCGWSKMSWSREGATMRRASHSCEKVYTLTHEDMGKLEDLKGKETYDPQRFVVIEREKLKKISTYADRALTQ